MNRLPYPGDINIATGWPSQHNGDWDEANYPAPIGFICKLTKTTRSLPEVPHQLNLNRTWLQDVPRRCRKKNYGSIKSSSFDAPGLDGFVTCTNEVVRTPLWLYTMQLFFYLFGPGINPLWRRGSGTTDPAQVYSIKVLNEWSVKFVCFKRLKVTISMQIHTAKSQMSIDTLF